jgi:phosphoserine phosphatase
VKRIVYRVSGFQDQLKRIKVLNDQVTACLDPYIYSAFIVDGIAYLKQSKEKIPFTILRKFVFDFDDTLTKPGSEPTYKLYFQKLMELNPELASRKAELDKIFSGTSSKYDPTLEMERLQRLLRICDFNERQHEDAVEHAVKNTKLVSGLWTALLDIRDMQGIPYIVSGSMEDCLSRIAKKLGIPPQRIRGSRMQFKEDGTFESFHWLLGYRKSEAIDELYDRRKHLQHLVSDNPISDFPMQTPYFNQFVDYGLSFNFAIWLSQQVDLPVHVRVFKPELRKDFSLLKQTVRAFDRAFLITEFKNEEEWQRLVNLANDVVDKATYIKQCPNENLANELEIFSNLCDQVLVELRPLFREGERLIRAELKKLSYQKNPYICREVVKSCITFFKQHVREFSVPRDFLYA